MTTAHIDGDILVYRVGYTTMEDDFPIAEWRMRELCERITDALSTRDARFYLTSTDKSNFRYGVFPDYKGHRTQPKPTHYLMLREHLIKDHRATVVEGKEADDEMGEQMTHPDNPPGCIVTIDKDLDMVPGDHYNFVKDVRYIISPLEAKRCFWEQVLKGDKSDNVEGIYGIGQVKAQRMLEGCESEAEMADVAVRQYQKAYDEEWLPRLYLAACLLWIRQHGMKHWHESPGLVEWISDQDWSGHLPRYASLAESGSIMSP